jgi:iron complex transport system ATP-binding protein
VGTLSIGSPEEVLTEQLLGDVFGVQADIVVHPLTGKIHITFLPPSVGVQQEVASARL